MDGDTGRISYSPNMAALVAARYRAKEDAENPVPYFPSRRHIDRGLAPERTLGVEDLQAIAAAQRHAQEQGVLTPEVARYMLPMAMVEGRPGNYGIVPNNRFYASPQNRQIFDKMGVPVKTFRDAHGDKFLQPQPEGHEGYARTMAAILAAKAARGKSPEDAVMRYNGRGSQARHYLNKVQTALELLNHQANQQFRQQFQDLFGAQSGNNPAER